MIRGSAARNYIKRIRNRAKKRYAEMYAEFLERGGLERGPEPERPKELSYMAAQAVRIELHAIYRAPASDFEPTASAGAREMREQEEE